MIRGLAYHGLLAGALLGGLAACDEGGAGLSLGAQKAPQRGFAPEYLGIDTMLLDGDLVITGAEGESRSTLKTGHSYFRKAGVEHDVKNGNPYEFAFIEIEMK